MSFDAAAWSTSSPRSTSGDRSEAFNPLNGDKNGGGPQKSTRDIGLRTLGGNGGSCHPMSRNSGRSLDDRNARQFKLTFLLRLLFELALSTVGCWSACGNRSHWHHARSFPTYHLREPRPTVSTPKVGKAALLRCGWRTEPALLCRRLARAQLGAGELLGQQESVSYSLQPYVVL